MKTRDQDGKWIDKPGRSIPHTDRQFVAINWDKGCWSIVHRASGCGVVVTGSRDLAYVAAQDMWQSASTQLRDMLRDNGDLYDLMAHDKAQNRLFATETQSMRRAAHWATSVADYWKQREFQTSARKALEAHHRLIVLQAPQSRG